MAEENEGQQDAEASGKSNKKMIIIIAIVALLAIGVSVGATLFLLGGDDEAAGEATEEVVEEVKAPAIYHDIKPPFLVTFDVEGRQRYLQVHASLMTRDAASLDAVDLHMPLIRNRVISVYSGLDFNTLRTSEGKRELQQVTLDTINEVLQAEGAEPLENVFFSNLVMQ